MSTKSAITQPAIKVIVCVGLIVTLLFKTSIFEAGVRNFAFTTLLKGSLQPALSLNEPLVRSRDLFDRLAVRDPVRFEPYQVRLTGLIERLQDDAFSIDGSSHLQAGARAAARNEWGPATGYYLDAIAYGPVAVREDAIQQLTGILDSQVEIADFGRYVYTDVGGPSSFPVAFDQCPQVKLMAIYIGEQSVALRQPVPIVIIWRIGTENLQEKAVLDELFQHNSGWELRRSGRFIFQIGVAINQILDGGFEQIVLPRAGLPPSLPRRLYVRQTQQHTQVVYESPDTGQNMVLLLDSQGDTSVGLGSSPMAVSATPVQEGYLVTGRYRTTGEAAPRIGIRWLLKDAKEWNDNVSSYIVREAADEWTPFAGILPPHPKAESFQYWVLNADAASQLFVDNLGIFPIPLPCAPQ